jgi:hypothetical protein
LVIFQGAGRSFERPLPKNVTSVPKFVLQYCVERAAFGCRMDRISVARFPRRLLLEAAARRDFGNSTLVRVTVPPEGPVGLICI